MSQLDIRSGSGDADLCFARWWDSQRTPILIVACLGALCWSVLFFSFTADDAFISFRYGKNLVLNHVWNWNSFGTREEAYTSALYTVIAILPVVLHISTVVFMKVVGIACVGVMLYRLNTLASSGFAKLLGIFALAITPVIWIHTYSGLETPLYVLLIVEMAIAVSRASETAPAWVYTLFLLLPLTRPEGVLFACLGVLFYWKYRGDASKQIPSFVAAIGVGVVYFLARWHYFHHLLPNPFYVKVSHESLRDLFGTTLNNLAAFKGYVFAIVLMLAIARKPATRCFAAGGLALILLLFAPHPMVMNYVDRFYAQLAIPIFILFLILEDVPRVSRFAATIAALTVLAFSPDEILGCLKYPANVGRAHFDIGQRLAPFAAGHTLIAGDVGGLPYYSNWFSYDFLGLGTNSVAQRGVDVASLQAMHPDLIVLYAARPGPALLTDGAWVGGSDRTSHALVDYINQSGEYEYATSAKSHGFYLVEFLRARTPQHDEILATLRENGVRSTIDPSLRNIVLQHYLPSSQ